MTKQQSAFGRFLDPVADKLLVASALLMMVAFGQISGLVILPALVILCREITVSGLREYLAGLQVSVPVSQLAKWKTTVQLVTVIVILTLVGLQEVAGYYEWAVQAAWAWLPLLSNGLMAAVLVLTLMSGFHYFFRTGSA